MTTKDKLYTVAFVLQTLFLLFLSWVEYKWLTDADVYVLLKYVVGPWMIFIMVVFIFMTYLHRHMAIQFDNKVKENRTHVRSKHKW